MSPQFTHLVWKEYRAQRALWLALVVGVGAVGAAIVSGIDSGISAHVGILTSLPVVVSLAFGVVAASTTFSGEEEEGTAVWLRQLPVRPSAILGAKLLVILVGTGALIVASGIIACIILLTYSGPFSISKALLQIPDLTVTLAGGVLCFFVSLFWSLRCNRVFATLGRLVASFLPCALALTFDSFYPTEGQFTLSALAAAAAISVFIFPSMKKWQLGLRHSKFASTSVQSISSRFPLSGYVHKKWQTTLQRAASQPTLLARATSMLLWREIRFAVPFAAVFTTIGIAFIATGWFPSRYTLPLHMCLIPMVVESGLRTFRHDQHALHGLFWSHRGASPAMVWGIRNVVWFGMVFAVCVGLICIEEFCVRAFGLGVAWQMQDRPAWAAVSMLPSPVWQMRTGGDFYNGAMLFSTWVCGAFVLSELCSCWIRKTVIAAGAAIASTILLTVWIGYSLHMDIPFHLTIWPLLLVLLLAIFATRRQWMDRRMSLKIGLQRSAWIAIPCLCVIPVQREWRATQIPVIVDDLPAGQPYSYYGYSKKNANSPTAGAWEQLITAAPSAFAVDAPQPFSSELMPTGENRERVLRTLALILDANFQTTRLPPKYRIPWNQSQRVLPRGTTNLLLSHSHQLWADGKPVKAIHRAVDAARVAVYLRQEATSWVTFMAAIRYERTAQQVIRQLAADDRLTQEDLQAIQDLTLNLSNDFTYNISTNRLAVYHQLLKRQGYLWNYYQKLTPSEQSNEWPNGLLNANSAERYRVLQLMQLSQDPSVYQMLQGYPSVGDTGLRLADLHRWMATSALSETDLESIMYWGCAADDLFIDVMNSERVTSIVVALQRYRRVHGEFPQTLDALKEFGIEPNAPVLQQANKDARFEYAPQGFGVPLPAWISEDVRLISGTQPIIWTHGNASPRHLNEPIDADVHDIPPDESGRVFYLSGAQCIENVSGVAVWNRMVPSSTESNTW